MNLGFFGGTFDPIHRGHIALASAAAERFNLGRVLFVPTSVSPLKQQISSTPYVHRFAMVVLATKDEKGFVPSLLEAPADLQSKTAKSRNQNVDVSYSIDTVRRLKSTLKKSDKLFFLLGIDAFKDIAKWREAEALCKECAFIVASRPGFSLADVANALPDKLRPAASVTKPFAKQPAKGDLVMRGVSIHLLDGVDVPISATGIRDAVAAKRPLAKFVDPAVADYIKKLGLYGSRSE